MRFPADHCPELNKKKNRKDRRKTYGGNPIMYRSTDKEEINKAAFFTLNYKQESPTKIL